MHCSDIPNASWTNKIIFGCTAVNQATYIYRQGVKRPRSSIVVAVERKLTSIGARPPCLHPASAGHVDVWDARVEHTGLRHCHGDQAHRSTRRCAHWLGARDSRIPRNSISTPPLLRAAASALLAHLASSLSARSRKHGSSPTARSPQGGESSHRDRRLSNGLGMMMGTRRWESPNANTISRP